METVSVWRDPDKRRALLLSLVLHLALLLALVVWMAIPRPEPLPSYIVLDVGTPALAEETTLAPTAEEPAPPAPSPQVASSEIGAPQRASAPEEVTQAPELEARTAQPPAPEAPPARAEASQAAPAEEASVPEPPLPQPSAPATAAEAPELPVAESPATVLPEIEPVVLQPRPTPTAITIPMPQARAEVPQARAIALTPSAAVAAQRDVATPQVRAAVAEAQPIETPRVEARVSASVGLSTPDVQAAVPEARPLGAPSVQAAVAEARAVDAPAVRADVAASVNLTAPDAQASVAPAVDLSSSGVRASVSGERPLAAPAVTAQVGTARDVQVLPTVAVAAARPVPLPSVRAEVVGDATVAGAPGSSGRPGATDVEATVSSPRTPGGNAAVAGQVGPPDDLAAAVGRGLAAGPDGALQGDGAPLQPALAPFADEREQALAVILDNVGGYPQHGLREASMIVELPVEGGLTRLMTIYDHVDPLRVGPVRSARDYFVELAERSSAVLVHDGGSPGAMIAITRSEVPTLNAYSSGELFGRSADRSAPYNLYSAGADLRAAVKRLLPDVVRPVAGVVFRPTAAASQVTEVSVRYSGAYRTGFRFDAILGAYRWVRDGTPANHPDGQVVVVDAVLVGEITARPLPDDPEGRLYVPLRAGDATLYLRGRAERGTWEVVDGTGIRFRTAAGELVDLSPFRTWVVLTPTYDERVEQ